MVPHEYQEKSIQHLLEIFPKQRAAIDGSDTGTGKTLVAVELMRRLNLPTLVVAPKATLPGWHRTAAAQNTELSALNYERLRMGRTEFGEWRGGLDSAKRHVRPWFRWNPAIRCLFFDEGHRCKGYGTQNAELLKAARRQNIPTLVMSATLADSPLEMDALGALLRLHDSDSPPTLRNPAPLHFLEWARRYKCSGLPPVFTGGTAEMAELNAQLYPAHGVRVRIDELGDQFPETQITAELYEIQDPARMDAIYADIAVAWQKLQARISPYRGGDALVYAMAERQEAELLKVPVFVELARDAVAQGMSVAIFVNFHLTLDEILSRLNTNCRIDGLQTGDRGAAVREANRVAFQSDRERVIGCISEAGGVGLDLHDVTGKHPRLSLISPGFNAKLLKQIFGRVQRSGGRSKSLQRLILAAGTVEEAVYRNFSRKLDNLSALNDGDLMPDSLVLRPG